MDNKRLFALIISVGVFFLTAFVYAIPVDINVAQAVAQFHIDVHNASAYGKTPVAPGEDYSGHAIRYIDVLSNSQTDEILGYMAILEPTGYIAISKDTDIRPVITYSFENEYILENTPGNFPLRILKKDLDNRLRAIPFMSRKLKARNNDLWEDYLARSENLMRTMTTTTIFGPYIDTEWNQGDPYNIFCPIDPETMERCPIGCVVTAMGQIVNYWEWPPSITFDTSDSYWSEPTEPDIWIDATTANIDTIDYNEVGLHPSDTTIARLLFACGVSIEMQYQDGGSMASSPDVTVAYVSKFGYTTALDIFPSSPNFYNDLAVDVIDTRTPYISCTDGEDGHAIVVDGYCFTGEFHVNYGWGGYADGWYFLPDELPYDFTIVTQGIISIIPPVITHRPVRNLTSSTLTGSYVRVAWEEPLFITEDILHYNVYRRLPSGSDNTLLGSTHINEFVDSTTAELTDYIYSVGAVYPVCGESRREQVDAFSGIYNGWTRMVGYYGGEIPYSAAPFEEHGFVSAGFTETWDGSEQDILIIAMNGDGDAVWEKTYGGSEIESASSIIQTYDSCYIVAGMTESHGAGGADIWLLKLDINGDTLWTRTFGGAFDDEAKSVVQTPDGGCVVAGYSNDGAEDLLCLIKTDADGDTNWTKLYTGGLLAQSIIPVSGGGYLIAGYINDGPLGDKDAFLMKTDADGDSLWTKVYGGSHHDEIFSVTETDDGGYVVAGNSMSYGIPMFTSIYLMKTDADGDTIWVKTYGGMQNYTANSVTTMFDGNLLIVGSIVNSGNTDLYLLCADPSGDTLWTHTYPTMGTDIGYTAIQLPDSGIAIAGRTTIYGSNDFWLMKIGGNLSTFVNEYSNQRPVEKQLLGAYPNPFNNAVTITIDGSELINQSPILEVFDINGRRISEIATDVNESAKPLSASTSVTHLWTPEVSLGSGIYLVRIKGKNVSTKIVYMK